MDWTGDVAPQRGGRERKHLSIGHRLFAWAMRRAKGTGPARISRRFFVADKRGALIVRGDPSRRNNEVRGVTPILFVEERRRLKIIPNGFGEKPVLKLMFGALIRAAERWRGLRFIEFELRQIAAVRKDLDGEYQTSITPLTRSSQPRVSSKSKP